MRNALRNYGILLVVFVSIVWGACGGGGDGGDCISEVSNTDFEESEPFSLPEVDAGTRTLFGLVGENGTITVTGSPTATSVTISGTKRVRSESFEDAQAHLADIVIDVDLDESPDAVFVETVQPQCTGGRNYIVDYTITLPSNFLVLVENFNGNVTIDTINNTVSVVLFNGDVTLNQINGSASATLFNGAIDADVTLPVSGEIKFDVANGNIVLAIPRDTFATFDASALIGNVTLSPILLENFVQTGGTPPSSLSGILGTGTGQGMIDLEVDNGDINVSDF